MVTFTLFICLIQIQNTEICIVYRKSAKKYRDINFCSYCPCHGSWVPGPVLTVSCLYACAYVWAGVCGCVWLRLIRSSWESSPLGYISSCHALPLVRSLQFAVDVYEAFLVPGFRDSWALLLSWTPIAGDSSAHCFPALPASAPTESSVSAYGKLRFCLRKAPLLPTESSASALRKLRLRPTESSV